jgi:hypothetical protein
MGDLYGANIQSAWLEEQTAGMEIGLTIWFGDTTSERVHQQFGSTLGFESRLEVGLNLL